MFKEMEDFSNYLLSLVTKIETLERKVQKMEAQLVNTPDERRPYNMVEASEYLRIPKGTLYNYISDRKIRNFKIGRSTFFRKQDLDEFIESNVRITKKDAAINFNTKNACRNQR